MPRGFGSVLERKMIPYNILITIDGPAGSGKSTVARALAGSLSCLYLDTGALYRAVALKIAETKTDWKDVSALKSLLDKMVVSCEIKNGNFRVLVDDTDVSDHIRSEEISLLASQISASSPVRDALLEVQRSIGRRGGVVAEGRDMGTIVFPWADVKFFLDASAEERARRRYEELVARGESVRFDAVAADMRVRDRQDRERSIAPLKPHPEAVIIDTTVLTVEEVVEVMVNHIAKRFPNN